MVEPSDSFLLREYAERQSESAFRELVQRHVNFVYSVAMRYAGNQPDAQDVAQAVFVILAQKSARLCERGSLMGWLYETTRLTAGQLLRSRIRRLAREQEAYMQSDLERTGDTPLWQQLSPHLEEAMSRLRAAERELLALRFYEKKTGEEAAVLLGIGAAAAHKRTNRALEKLRKFFASRGVASTTAIIAGAISINSVQAAPLGLAQTISAAAVIKGAAASTSTLTLVRGALKIMSWTKAQTAIAVGVTVLLSAATTATLVVRYRPHLPEPHPVMSGQSEFPRASWAFAGFADPQSAMMSLVWASCQPDQQVYEACLTDSEKKKYRQMIQINMKVPQPHSEAEEVIRSVQRANEMWRDGSFQIVDQRMVSSDLVILHLVAHGSSKTIERYIKMTKIGREWKYDGFKWK
jgi:RNA polymerase sigma factor (sigma-70 family)